MRILIVSPWLGDLYGQERMVAESARILRARGHQVFALTTVLKGDEFPSYLDGGRVVDKLNACTFLMLLSEVERILRETRAYLNQIKPDIIHLIDGVDPRISALFNEFAPTILSVHSVGATCPSSTRMIRKQTVCSKRSGYSCLAHDLSYRCLSEYGGIPTRVLTVVEHLRRYVALEKYTAVVAVSEYIRDLLLLEGVPEAKVQMIYNPVYVPSEGIKAAKTPTPLLVSVARLVPLKGLSLLIQACSNLKAKEWTLWICGDGSQRKELESLVEKFDLKDRIKLFGHVPHSQVLEIVSSAYMVIQSNVGPEAFGLSVGEASALGVPVVAFDVPGINEVIRDGENGILVVPNDISELARNIDLLLSDSLLHARLSKGGPDRMQRLFSSDKHADETLSLYQRLIGRGEWLMQTSL
jgi:glycosyltransferase involved in cell wall biosynthesis